jgi:SAM-dependent methyltransferase
LFTRKAPRVIAVLLDHVLAHTVFQIRLTDRRGDIYRPRGRAWLATTFNRALVERGVQVPWMWSAERCQRFWSSLERGDDPNAPNGYAAKPLEIVDLMQTFWSPEVALGDAVLEVGCNAGANLARLRELGYPSLSGVEINPAAIEELRCVFPALAEVAEIRQGRVEDVLPRLPTDGFEVVFAMGVLHHIHPSSNQVFAELVRVARCHICTIEPEQLVRNYIFSRDYRRVFEGLGCTQVRAVELRRARFPEVDEAYHGCTMRLFAVP